MRSRAVFDTNKVKSIFDMPLPTIDEIGHDFQIPYSRLMDTRVLQHANYGT